MAIPNGAHELAGAADGEVMTSKRRAAIAVLGVLFGALLGGACIALDDSSKGSTSSSTTAASLGDAVASVDGDGGEDGPKWLFSHTSEGGTITPGPDGTVVLTLTGIDQHVVAFTDRPDRRSEIIDVRALVMAWPSMFADSAPNAVLVEHEPNGTDSSVLELTEPRLDGSTLTFTAKVLEVEAAEGPTVTAADQADPTMPPASFRAASLFIDDVDPSAAKFDCVNANGARISPPGQVSVFLRPIAPYMALCSDAGGTVITD